MAKNRSEIKEEFKWDLSKMYPTRDALIKDMDHVEECIKNISTYKGKISDSVDNFYNLLVLMEDADRVFSNVYAYCNMKHHEDTRIQENLADSNKADMLSADLSKAMSFVTPEILSMDENVLDEYMKDTRMERYKRMLDDILRAKAYVLSEKEEKILAAAREISQTPENTYNMLCYADMSFPEIEDENGEKVRIDHFNYSTYIKSPNKRVRHDAYEAEFSTYKKYSNTMAAILYGNIKAEIMESSLRGYPSALYASLFADNVSVDVYENLIESMHNNLKPLNKYLDIKKKYLGLDEMNMYDLYLPMAKDFKMEIPYEKAKEIILEALKPMGEDYLNIIRKAFDERWIDLYENEGKKGGAYSWGSYDSYPYILMSYTDDLNSMFTLAHELGHSAHSYLSRQAQPFIDSSYKIFVAEVASTVNETLLIKHMIKNAKSKEEKIYLLNYYLEQYRTTVYRQTLFAEFEKITHSEVEAKKPMTAAEFNRIFFDLNKLYYGESCNVDELISYEWARIPHFYSNFYVYKYATGFCAASVLSDRILNAQDGLERYIEFLQSGGSKYPLDQLKDAGVDMTNPETVDKALNLFSDLVDELKDLVEH